MFLWNSSSATLRRPQKRRWRRVPAILLYLSKAGGMYPNSRGCYPQANHRSAVQLGYRVHEFWPSEGYKASCAFEKLSSTYVGEYPIQFVVQPVRKTREQTSCSTKHHVAQQNLTNVGIARSYGSADELRKRFWKVWIARLRPTIQ